MSEIFENYTKKYFKNVHIIEESDLISPLLYSSPYSQVFPNIYKIRNVAQVKPFFFIQKK